MLDVARPQVRTRARAQSRRSGWGIVDVMLGVLMLPFGIWMYLIERVVGLVAAIGKR